MMRKFGLLLSLAVLSIIFICCSGGSGKSSYIGQNISELNIPGVQESNRYVVNSPGVIGYSDDVFVIVEMRHIDGNYGRDHHSHIFLCQHTAAGAVIVDQLNFDPETPDNYAFDWALYDQAGVRKEGRFVMRMDPEVKTIEEIFFIDVHKRKFVAQKPLENMMNRSNGSVAR